MTRDFQILVCQMSLGLEHERRTKEAHIDKLPDSDIKINE
jgi:hypothetical protein